VTLTRLVRSAVVQCVSLLVLGCLAEQPAANVASPQGPATPRDVVSGYWLFHIDGGEWVSGITLATISPAADGLMEWRGTETPSRQWDGSTGPTLGLSDAVALPLEGVGQVEWRWRCPSGQWCRMSYQVVADTARGEFSVSDSAGFEEGYPMFGVRLRAGVFGLASAANRLTVMSDSTPTVLLWLADDPAQDRDFIGRLRSRGLTALLAIPTYFVGRQGRPGWNELHNDEALGFGIAAHSRRHSSTTVDGPDFVGEVLGSIADLDSMGLATTMFVEPGNWSEAIAFDSVSKFRTWRGSLIRTFVGVFASRFGPGSQPTPLTAATAFGIGHWTVSDGLPDSTILSLWRQANRRGHFTTFGVHTWKLPYPGRLDWFLDSLSHAQTVGRVKLISAAVRP
jgi:hypothetical protein